MSSAFNTLNQRLHPNIHKKITQWLGDYVQFAPNAYDAAGNLRVSSIQMALLFMIDQGVFENADEIKREFGKEHKAIIPDFLFKQGVQHDT